MKAKTVFTPVALQQTWNNKAHDSSFLSTSRDTVSRSRPFAILQCFRCLKDLIGITIALHANMKATVHFNGSRPMKSDVFRGVKENCVFATTSAKAANQLCFKHDALPLTLSALTIVHIVSYKYKRNQKKFQIWRHGELLNWHVTSCKKFTNRSILHGLIGQRKFIKHLLFDAKPNIVCRHNLARHDVKTR